MTALRKMLGSLEDPAVIGLMRQIETQSRETLALWAAGEARARMLPLLQKTGCQDPRPAAAIEAATACARGEMLLKAAKPALAEARKAAQELTATPVQQAAARAIATASAVMTTPTNALGYVFYFAAAVAYDTAGTDAPRAVHDDIACAELARLLTSLRAASVQDEPHPVKVAWNC